MWFFGSNMVKVMQREVLKRPETVFPSYPGMNHLNGIQNFKSPFLCVCFRPGILFDISLSEFWIVYISNRLLHMWMSTSALWTKLWTYIQWVHTLVVTQIMLLWSCRHLILHVNQSSSRLVDLINLIFWQCRFIAPVYCTRLLECQKFHYSFSDSWENLSEILQCNIRYFKISLPRQVEMLIWTQVHRLWVRISSRAL